MSIYQLNSKTILGMFSIHFDSMFTCDVTQMASKKTFLASDVSINSVNVCDFSAFASFLQSTYYMEGDLGHPVFQTQFGMNFSQ